MDKILLLIDHPRNRELLKEWLGNRYMIVEVVPPIDLTTEFDLAVVDGVSLDQLWQDIHERKTAEQPVFLPILFFTNRKDVGMITRHLWKSIDDIIWTPIEKIELIARVEVLMRARHLSLELHAANQIKLNFLAMISHELRTPLTSIKGFSSTLLAEDVQWSAEIQHEFLETIGQEAAKMEELVEQLLDLSRLQAGHLSVHPQPVSFGDILQDAGPQISVITAAHQFLVEMSEPLPIVRADARRISQVLVNIIGNACKFAPEGSTIQVQVARENGYVCTRIIDQGPGIPEDERSLIFEAFRQVGKSTDKKGLGLGLAIAKHIVEAHDGTIWIGEREPGTEVIFTLPIAGDEVSVASD